MTQTNADYVKECIEEDLERNRELGRDYSIALAGILKTYLTLNVVSQTIASSICNSLLDVIEEAIEKTSGEKPDLRRTRECGIEIWTMKQYHDETGIKQIKEYAEELTRRREHNFDEKNQF